MLRIYTLTEAIAELNKRTGSEWSSSRIFDAALRMDLQLRAAPKDAFDHFVSLVLLIRKRTPIETDKVLAEAFNDRQQFCSR